MVVREDTPSPLPAGCPTDRSARCKVSYLSSSGSLPYWSTGVPWPASLPVSPALAESTTVPAGASKLYSWRASTLCSGLVPSVCLGWALSSSAAAPRCVHGGSGVLGPPISPSSPSLALRARVARVVGEFSSPPRLRPSSLGPPLLAVVPLGGLSPWGNSTTPGVSAPCGNLTPPPTPCQDPRGFSSTLEASRPPSSSPTPEHSWATLEALWPLLLPRTPEVCWPFFPAGPPVAPFAPALHHGGTALPYCWLPRRGLYRCFPAGPHFPM